MPTLNLTTSNDIRSRLNDTVLFFNGKLSYLYTDVDCTSTEIKVLDLNTAKTEKVVVVNRTNSYSIIDNQFINFSKSISKQNDTYIDQDEDSTTSKEALITQYLTRIPSRQYSYGHKQNNHRLEQLNAPRNAYNYRSFTLTYKNILKDNMLLNSLNKKYPTKSILEKLNTGDSIALSPNIALLASKSGSLEIYHKSTLVGLIFNNVYHIPNKIYQKSTPLIRELQGIGFNAK